MNLLLPSEPELILPFGGRPIYVNRLEKVSGENQTDVIKSVSKHIRVWVSGEGPSINWNRKVTPASS